MREVKVNLRRPVESRDVTMNGRIIKGRGYETMISVMETALDDLLNEYLSKQRRGTRISSRCNEFACEGENDCRMKRRGEMV